MSLLWNVAEDAKLHSGGSDYENKIIEKLPFKSTNRVTGYLISKVKLTFTLLKKLFTKVLVFWQFNPKSHIQIEANMPVYTIKNILR